MVSSITVRRMRETDVDAADRLLQAAFERPASFQAHIRLSLALEPDGVLVAQEDGRLVGTVGAVDYGRLAYIGLMAVDPSRQGHGIGRMLMGHLLHWLDERSCPMALLDATDQGARLYEKLGFVDDATAVVFERASGEERTLLDKQAVAPDEKEGALLGKPAVAPGEALVTAPAVAPGTWPRISETRFCNQPTSPVSERPPYVATNAKVSFACADDLAGISAFDARLFGADRAKLVAALWPEHGARCLVARDGSDRLTGFLFARDPVFGPWLAESPGVAEDLLSRALALEFANPPHVMVPRSNALAAELLLRHGFGERRRLRHMCRGGDGPPGSPECLFGQSSFAHG